MSVDVGSKAPDFTLMNQERQPVTLSAQRGKPVVLFFWWEACGDCKMQAQVFRRVVERYAPRGVSTRIAQPR